MGCLLVLVVAATVLTGPSGKLTHAARTSPAEAFWRAALPGAPMPEAIRELLHPGAAGSDARPRHYVGDPPPMDFKYDYDNSTLRNEAAAAPSAEVLDRVAGAQQARNAAASPKPTVFFLEDAVRVGGILPFPSNSMIPRGTANAAVAAPPALRVYTVRAVRAVDGCRFLVCRREAGAGAGPDGDDVERDAAVYGCRATGPARAYVVGMVGERGGETATAAVVCRTDGRDTPSRWDWAARTASFWLLGVKPGGAAAAAVCYAALDARVIPVKNDMRSSLV